MWIYPVRINRGTCGKLKSAMYGARDAAQNWELEYTQMMVEAGFTQGSHSTCDFYHKQMAVRTVACGDDFTVLGCRGGLAWLREVSVAWR